MAPTLYSGSARVLVLSLLFPPADLVRTEPGVGLGSLFRSLGGYRCSYWTGGF